MACSLSYVLTSLSGDCTNSNLGGFSIDITGTAPDYSIQWVNPALGTIVLGAGITGYTATTLSAGTYSFNILDSCLPTMTSLPVNINISSGTCVSISGIANTTCNVSNGSITGQTSNFYGLGTFSLYNILTGFISSGTSFSNTYSFPDLSSGIYYVIADDGGGCSGQSETTIIQPSTNINWGFYTVMDSGCANVDSGKIYVTGLTGTSPFTYLWSNGETDDFITGLTAGSYSVLITDSLGCTLSQDATIIEVETLGFGSFTAVPPTCFNNDGQVTLVITGGTGPYYYSASTGVINVSFSSSQTFYGIGGGPFSVQVTDAALCKITPTTTIIPPNGFNIVSVTTTNSNCGGSDGKLNINLEGGEVPFTYTLTNSLGDSYVQTNNFRSWVFTNLASGTYTLTISDNGGCTYVSSPISINNTPLFTFTADTTGTTCNLNNGYVEITISGGTPPYTYNIGSESFTTPLSAYTFDNLYSGAYSLTLTESTPGIICRQTSSFNITTSNNVDFLISGTDANNGNDGTVSASIINGTPPFTLLWSNNVNGQTGYYLSNLSAGTYSLQVTDDDGCVKVREVPIDGFDLITSFQTFNICDSEFENIDELVKKGPKEMLNEGYYDLTSGYTNCILNQAAFSVVATIGDITNISQFFISYALNNFPTDEEYFEALVALLKTFDQVAQVNIDELNNGIQIIAKCEEQYLVATDVTVDMFIEYNISCQYCSLGPTLTSTPTPTPTTTPTNTPTPTQTLTTTPTQTPTQTLTQTSGAVPTNTPTQTLTPTNTPTKTPTNTPTPTSTPTPTTSGIIQCPENYTIGQAALGGTIAYILQSEDPGYNPNLQQGLVATVADISQSASWGCDGTLISGADGIAIGTGAQNTIDIMNGCSTAGIAARLCGDLVLGGYSDWYLPSINELNKLYLNRVAIGGFASASYWSSTEFNATDASTFAFDFGFAYNNLKTSTYPVRGVRAFTCTSTPTVGCQTWGEQTCSNGQSTAFSFTVDYINCSGEPDSLSVQVPGDGCTIWSVCALIGTTPEIAGVPIVTPTVVASHPYLTYFGYSTVNGDFTASFGEACEALSGYSGNQSSITGTIQGYFNQEKPKIGDFIYSTSNTCTPETTIDGFYLASTNGTSDPTYNTVMHVIDGVIISFNSCIPFNVTNNGGSAYIINLTSNPVLTLIKGVTYKFNIDAMGYPFWIKTEYAPYGLYAYSNVQNNGEYMGLIILTVPYNAPVTLFYNCGNLDNYLYMRNTINIIE